jgi:hypothetical protein
MEGGNIMLKDITRTSIYKQLKGKLYYPYYLSGPKVEFLFAQLWGDIKSYSKGRLQELSLEIGLQGKTTGLLKWLADLVVSTRTTSKIEWNLMANYDVPDLARLLVLRRFLEDTNRVKKLTDLSSIERDTPHLFVEHVGSFTFATDTEDVNLNLSAIALQEINRLKKFEEKAEKDLHFLFFLPGSEAIALIANRYLNDYGLRFLLHPKKVRSISFFGSTIGEVGGLLFLDPIAIGYHEKEQILA